MGVFLGTVARIDEVSSNYLYKIEEDLKTRLYSTKFSKEPKFEVSILFSASYVGSTYYQNIVQTVPLTLLKG